MDEAVASPSSSGRCSSNSITYHLDEGGQGTFVSYKVRLGGYVYLHQPLLTYTSDGKQCTIKAKSEGAVTYINDKMKKGAAIEHSTPLCTVGECEHAVVMKDMCADCGKDLRKQYYFIHKPLFEDGLPGERTECSQAHVPIIHAIPELHVSPQVALVHGSADEANLLRQRKLVLLVDLDQTLIHTTNEQVPVELHDVHHFQLYGAQSPWYHTRLRPNTRAFLQHIASKYELHICTFGQRLYAHQVAAILDPDKTLFGQRILSRDECFDQQLKTANLKCLFAHGDHMVVVIDDREDVWNFAKNVVQVKPYRYFKETGDINAPAGFSKTEESHDLLHDMMEIIEKEKDSPDEEDEKSAAGHKDAETAKNGHDDDDDDDYLVHLQDILERLHSAFYSFYDKECARDKGDTVMPDMNIVLPYVKTTVLSGVRLLFSGVIPTNMPLEHAPICQLVEQFGAKVHRQFVPPRSKSALDDQCTTHVVAARWGTNKVHQAARYPLVQLVQPQWLWTCIERWQHLDEQLYPVNRHTAVDPAALPALGKPKKKPIKSEGSNGAVPMKRQRVADGKEDAADDHTAMDTSAVVSEPGDTSGLQQSDGSDDFDDDDVAQLENILNA